MPVTHSFVSVVPDEAAAGRVRPNEWNDPHVVQVDLSSSEVTGLLPTANIDWPHIYVEPTGGDDTVALNAFFAEWRAAVSLSVLSNGSVIKAEMAPGFYTVTDTINATGIRAFNAVLECNGAVIWGKCAGKPVIDRLNSRFWTWNNLTIYGDATDTPSYGVQSGMISSANCGDSCMNNINIDGYFTKACYYSYSDETTTYHKPRWYNKSVAAGSYVLILDGGNYQDITSAFVTQTNAVGTARSFNESLFTQPDFRKENGGRCIKMMGRTLRRPHFLNGYAVSVDDALIELNNVLTLADPVFDIHCETSGCTKYLLIDNVNPASDVTIYGMKLKDHAPQANTCMIDVTGSTRTVNLISCEIDCGDPLTTIPLFGNTAASPAKILIDGVIKWPSTKTLDMSQCYFTGEVQTHGANTVTDSNAATADTSAYRLTRLPTTAGNRKNNYVGDTVIAGDISADNLSGTNTGNQTSIVGITGTKAQFDTAVTDGNILYVGDVTQYTDELAQDAIGAMVNSSLTYVDGTPSLGLTSRTINGTAFDGTGNITVTAAAGTLTGATLASGVTASSLTSLGSQAQALNMNSHLINNVTDPVSAQDAATKNYVDGVAQGLSIKQSVQYATAAALPTNIYSNGVSGVGATLTGVATGVLTVDGSAVALNNRLAIKDEVTAANNGIYSCTTAGALGVAYVLTRVADMNQAAEIPGAFVFVENGTVNDGAGFTVADAGPYTIGTTAINWTQFSGAGEVIAGAALTKSGNTLDVAVDGSSIEVNSDALRVKALGITNAMLAGSIDLTTKVTGDLPFANLTQIAGFSILAKATTGTGDVAALTAGTDSILMRSGSGDLTFGTIVTNQITADAVTYAKMQNVSATSRVLGRITAGAGDIEELTGANIATIANASFDHGTLTGLSDDDHTQYALLAGRSGGQTLIGGTASGNNLTLQSTSNATKGSVVINDGTNTWHNLSVLAGTSTVFNEMGADTDFRIEGDTDSNLFFADASADTVGIGIAATAKFEVAATTAATRGAGFAYYFDDSQAGNLSVKKARGTIASPTSIVSGDTMGGFGLQGYGATAGTGGFKNGAFVRAVAAENFSNTAAGSYLKFDTTPIGSTTLAERMRLTEAGNMKLGGTVNRGTTEGTNHLDIFDGTAPVGTLANGISLYSTSGELRVMDSGGTATLLSSHSRKTGEWIHDSYNVINKKRLVVQAEKMAKFIDEKFGTNFVQEFYDAVEA